MSYGNHFVHQDLYQKGILDLCLCISSCPYSNMVCKNCPFSYSYHIRFRSLNANAKMIDKFFVVHSSASFVNCNSYFYLLK